MDERLLLKCMIAVKKTALSHKMKEIENEVKMLDEIEKLVGIKNGNDCNWYLNDDLLRKLRL